MSYTSFRPPSNEDLGLKRLYRTPIDKLPISEQTRYYKQRNMIDSKLFRIGNAIWGSQSRTRILNAPYDIKKSQQSVGNIPPHVTYDQSRGLKSANNETYLTNPITKLTSPTTSYTSWLQNRMTMRTNLNNMGLNESWLSSKHKTELETRVLRKTRKQKIANTESFLISSEKTSNPPSLPDDSEADALFPILQRIASYLRRTKLRPLELFASVDKDKNWQISADEMRNVVRKYKFPILNEEVDFLLKALDVNGDGEIDYREFINGLKQFQNEARERSRSTTTSLLSLLSEEGDKTANEIFETSSNQDGSQKLTLPSPSDRHISIILDNTPEEKQLKDKRSRKEAKLRVIEEENYKELYQKATRTTITGEVKEAVYLKKKQLLEEYNKAIELCRQGNVLFSKELLKRATCKGDIRQGGTDLISYNQLMGIKKKAKKVTKPKLSGIERIYPPKRYVTPSKDSMKLSTGLAEIQCKTDCWMTFEEFEKIIRDIPINKFLVDRPRHDSFWPGQIVSKVRLYLDINNLSKSSNNGLFAVINNNSSIGSGIKSNHRRHDLQQHEHVTGKNFSYIQYGGLELRKSYVL
ncbi:uncharacterized protein TRIADDRAFT_52466 [Trichoplax adhaerens]|uniref:EF-hand domain-containing protein n=1 Tax=Trichoplax adhaerens TaxID=10228 RepID=B3RIN1_TRIAD|nr:hypothetical protein TRIADDRAFT_52466 [Trichoplax adhaerens]EDV29013.1 hypothetical protein TRIADDRAFT_52466 [Trichoplax adhaerens]|eukprot:XP_002108215.1 hypothetical protein TRIADDRAFT_52466 [Trichoplax adhaerens]